jgi:hypothetical protein
MARVNRALYLNRVPKEPSLILRDVPGILRAADPSYSTADDKGTRAQNADGYFVDLFCPEVDPPAEKLSKKDLDPIAAEGIDWLVKAPKIEETVIGSDGMPLYLPCVDPRVFALHKLWLSKAPSRQAVSRPRDRSQAHAVAVVAQAFLELKFKDRALGFLPAEVRAGADELSRIAKEYGKRGK